MMFTSLVSRLIFSILLFREDRDLIQSQVILPPVLEDASCNPCRACGEVHQNASELWEVWT